MRLPVVAIIGQTNAGKSSLFNRLVRKSQAIVAREEGTTRDNVMGRVDDLMFLSIPPVLKMPKTNSNPISKTKSKTPSKPPTLFSLLSIVLNIQTKTTSSLLRKLSKAASQPCFCSTRPTWATDYQSKNSFALALKTI